MNTLKAVCRQLGSEKVKDRQEGLSSVRSVFSRDSVIDNLDEHGTGKPWLAIFQALFETAIKEKAICTRPTTKSGSTNTAERRLSEVASVIRWLTERSVHILHRKVIKVLLIHLLQMCVYQGQLYTPVALDYAKTIRCVVSYTPHLEHLDDETWVRIVEMGFNVVLGDSLRVRIGGEEGDEEGSIGMGTEGGDSDLPHDDENDLFATTSTQTKKRRRREASGTPGPSFPRPSPSSAKVLRSVSLEQIEFASLLAILLRSPSAPLLSSKYPCLANDILTRLLRFIRNYSEDTSLHQDFLAALSATLSHLALNKRSAVSQFALGAWDGLIGIWGTKNKSMKEGLVVVLRILFPYYTAGDPKMKDVSLDGPHVDGMTKLWNLLGGTIDNRWGFQGLSLESLRLQLTLPDDLEGGGPAAFVARTFRYGWNFDSAQALAWANLELQADCAEKLFLLSESIHSASQYSKRDGKRIKLDNPISLVLDSIRTETASAIRVYNLQRLLFIIDRHWSIFYDSLHQDIMSTLLQFLTFDDAVVQSWTFLCLSAIADRQMSLGQPAAQELNGPSTWDPIWTHAMRRAVVPVVCRAACHVAYTLLYHAKRLLNSQRVLVEIETFAKDLDVQGPPFPYDSVCVFMALCLQVAVQDMRLYRMHLEEKVISWLVDSWSLGVTRIARGSSLDGIRIKLTHPTVADMMTLLESICGLSKRSSLICRAILPECAIVQEMQDEHRTAIIRGFLLHARLPPFHRHHKLESNLSITPTLPPANANKFTDLAQPGSRERKVSAALLKFLESLVLDWESLPETGVHLSAEKARRFLDCAILALSFESLLVFNGIWSNRRVLQTACKLVAHIAPLLTMQRWTLEEKAVVVLGFEPLIASDEEEDDAVWEGLLSPVQGTGIRNSVLQELTSNMKQKQRQMAMSRRELQRIIWRSSDVQDVFAKVMVVMKDVLRFTLSKLTGDNTSLHPMDINDEDDFAPIRTALPTATSFPETHRQTYGASSAQYIITVCMSFLSLGPILQSPSGEPTRDKELTMLILNSDADEFLLASPSYFNNVRQRTMNLNITALDNFLDKFESLLLQYAYSRSEKLQLLVIQFLDSTVSLWTQESVVSEQAGEHARSLCRWLLETLRTNKIRSWRIRDSLVAFLDRYLAEDPLESVWSVPYPGENDEEIKPGIVPTTVLPTMSIDEDIRVRFRVAYVNARLFTLSRFKDSEPMELYGKIHSHLSTQLTEYEHMLTRFITLGNIMVVSSAVRRGPYWHLLEACNFTDDYSSHIEAVFSEVSKRMGLSRTAELFEIYISQIAYSVFKGGHDFLRFSPHVLGYRDRRDCAEAAFRAFTLVNILAGDNAEEVAQGQHFFANHCKAVSKSVTQGFRECFADLVGYQLTRSVEALVESGGNALSNTLEHSLIAKLAHWDPDIVLDEQMQRDVDGIVVAILRTLGDQDCSPDGSIVQELRLHQSDRAAEIFQHLTRHRIHNDTLAHRPNLPAFETKSVLLTLNWFAARIPDAVSAATSYHVLHQLLAAIQQSPLVNEQLRCLNALCLWISCHYRHFREPILLHALVNGASSLLTQIDLARAAQSILQWAFAQYSKSTDKDSRLPDVLIRTCCLAHDYSMSMDINASCIGNDLLQWLEHQVVYLATMPHIKPQVINALTAWPRKLTPDLALLYQDVSLSSLSSVLADPRITSNKFRVVRRFRDLSITKQYPSAQFSRIDFWRLKDCIPPSPELQDDDINAFAILLLVQKGQIHSFGTNPLSAQSTHHRRQCISRTKVSKDSAPMVDPSDSERSILEALLLMLDSDDPARVNSAYRVLRTLASTELPDLQLWSSEYVYEMNYFRKRPLPSLKRPAAAIYSLELPSFVDIAKDFRTWVSAVATLISDVLSISNPFYSQLPVILQSDTSFTGLTLPLLTHTLLRGDLAGAATTDGRSCRTILSRYFTSVLSSTDSDVQSLRAVVNVALHLRQCRPGHSSDALAYDKWLDIDFILLSKSAIACGAYTTALLFHELAVEYQGEILVNKADDAERILFDIYSHIEEPDSFYGIKARDFHHFLMRRLHHEKQWEKAFQFHGAALEANSRDPDEAEGVLQSLHSFGFDNLALSVQHHASDTMGGVHASAAMSYHLGWRTETWDLPEKIGTDDSGAALYQALRAVYRERDTRSIDTTVRAALLKEMERLRLMADEDLVGIHEVTQNIICLHQVKLWGSNEMQKSLQSKDIKAMQWADFSQIDSEFDFLVLESIMATRIALLRSVRQKEQRTLIGTMRTPFVSELYDIEKRCLLRISEAARESQNLQIALNSVTRAQNLELKEASPALSQELSYVLWLKKEPKSAVGYMKDLIDRHFPAAKLQSSSLRLQKAQLLARLGAWSSEACLQKPTDIWSQYFDPAATLLSDIAAPDSTHATVYHECAMFADRQYQAIVKSPDAIRLKMYADRKEKEIYDRYKQIKQVSKSSREYGDLARDQSKAEKQLREDQARYHKHTEARNIFLQQAIDMYSRCLEASDAFDDDAHIRLTSLWFANFDDLPLQTKVCESVERVPSRKFVFLAHQLSARLFKPFKEPMPKSQEILQALVLRMCSDHPFHSLYQVYCLMPHPSSSASSRRLSARNDHSFSQGERAAAATDIFDRLRSDSSSNTRISSIEEVCYASIHWAKFPIKEKGKNNQKKLVGPFPIPETAPIRKLQNVLVPVLTAHTPLDPTTRYQDCIWISRYETTYDTAGGVNLPKVTICCGSNGTKYKQLFKGEGDDDLRQDAVMEQVFDLVNVVLRRDRETRKRNLNIRAYKVIPLEVQAGIIEFVGNTSPLVSWLQKAHPKYNPTDISREGFHTQMYDLREKYKRDPTVNSRLIALFAELKLRFRPVMRHYFTEKHKLPMSWFAMRLNYTRSVATTSIVGHILGLGDRHTSNILMDNATGEVVPIDLGIAFEQGKLLPIPELVPFRMTPDMVDGMGTSGTQGVFQRCAEETLRVLREGSEVILTVLEVFKYDPLHSWTATEMKLKRVQGGTTGTAQQQPTHDQTHLGIGIDMSSGGVDEAADRALTSVARKLDKSLSVEYTVNELLAEATDPANLACMFIGWSPYW